MVLLFLLLPLAVMTYQPKIITNAGEVWGFQTPVENGQTADIFLGVPYARPPVGDLRFEKPQPPAPWSTPFNATKWGKECPAHTPLAVFAEADEDCLSLNIIRPSAKAPSNGYPILFWIHGGGYSFGTARRYPYQGFADAYTTRDVIVVTIQYRLGFLGFLSNGQDDLPGNLGLWDMTQALKFVHDNGENFGGDPSRITLWGLSAGGAAVSQLLLSPHSRDYAVGGIEMSGSAWNNWVIGHQVVDHSLPLIEALGCAENTKECLKKKSIEEIYTAVDKVGYVLDNLLITKWGPRPDGDFFPKDLETLAKEAPKKPVLIGVTEKEAASMTIMDKSSVIHRLLASKDLLTFGEEEIKERIYELVVKSAEYGDQTDKLVNEIISFYSKGGEGDPAKYLNDYTEFVSDIVFNLGVAKGAEIRRKAGWPIHLYKFEHYNDAIWEKYKVPDGVRGSVHINEFPYMFELFGLAEFNYTPEDKIIRNSIRDSFATFAHNGMASWGGQRWKEAGEEANYLRIKPIAEEDVGFFKKSLAFWEEITKTTGYDLIEMTKTTKKKEEL